MATPEEQWWSVRAAEYLLGTLTNADHKLFEKILEHDTDLQLETARWAQRLAGLNETTEAIVPNERVWKSISQIVQQGNGREFHQTNTTSGLTQLDGPSHSTSGSAVSDLSAERVNRAPTTRSTQWKIVAAFSTAASLVLGVLLFQSKFSPDPTAFKTDGVAVVLSDDSGVPYFLIETDYLNAKVRVTTLAPPELTTDDAFQLWQAMPDRSSVRAVSRLPKQVGSTAIFDAKTLIEGSDLFGVSIESIDASTLEGPLGPVVAHGDFLQTQPSD